MRGRPTGTAPHAPSAGFEPARPAPEAGALSPELRGQTRRIVSRCCGDAPAVRCPESREVSVSAVSFPEAIRRCRREPRCGSLHAAGQLPSDPADWPFVVERPRDRSPRRLGGQRRHGGGQAGRDGAPRSGRRDPRPPARGALPGAHRDRRARVHQLHPGPRLVPGGAPHRGGRRARPRPARRRGRGADPGGVRLVEPQRAAPHRPRPGRRWSATSSPGCSTTSATRWSGSTTTTTPAAR